MELNDVLSMVEDQNRGRWFQLLHPVVGAPTGISVLVAGPDSRVQADASAQMIDDLAEVAGADGRVRGADRAMAHRLFKSARKGSTFELTCGLDPTDAGQLALRAAYETQDQYAVRISLSDKPSSGASPKNSTRTFAGMVMECADDLSGGTGKVKFTIQVNSNLVATHASAT